MNLVVGATGLLGGMIARKLVAKGEPVRVLVRRSSDPSALVADGAEFVIGDLKDPRSLESACQGVKRVITSANAAQRGGEDTIEAVDLIGNRALIDAAAKAGVEQFVFVSAAGAVDESSPVPLFAAKAKSESYLRGSGLPWTVIAPHVFMDVWFPMIIGSALAAQRSIPLVSGGKMRQSFVAIDDVAALTVAAVGHPRALHQRLVLGGPEALSWTDLVDETGRVIGRTLRVENLQPGQAIPALPAPADQAIGLMMAGLEQQEVIIDSTEVARTFGVSLTPARAVLERLFGRGTKSTG